MIEKEKAKAYDKKIREAILNGLIDCRDAPDLGWSNFGGIHIDDCIDWLEKQDEQASSQTNERAWLYLVSDVLTWKDGIGQYLDDPRVQELAKRLCNEYAQKLYNPSILSNSSNTEKNEQKSADKIESKFHKGDWITIDKPCQIINIHDNGNYIVQYCDDEKMHELSKNFCESYFHLWTIQDAKDGDFLCCKSGWMCIFKSLNNHTNTFSSYCFMDSDKCFFNNGGECHTLDKEFILAYNGEIHPATKEQRDLLFQKIKEAGYKWNTETKTLEKLVEPKFKVGDKIMKKKYKLTEENISYFGRTLYRIEALKDFDNVKKGDKGGYVESEENLSQRGNCWIYDNAKVCGNAYVCGDAIVCGNAIVFGNAVVYNSAVICDSAVVYDNAEVSGDSQVYDNAIVSGNVLVYDDAKVCGNAEVYGYVQVCGDAKIKNSSDYIVFKNCWSSGRYFTWTRSNNMWRVGCFYGTGEELIKKAYKDSELSGREYERVVNYVESILQDSKGIGD